MNPAFNMHDAGAFSCLAMNLTRVKRKQE